MCGTGTEDYIGSGWGQVRYSNLYLGCPLSVGEAMQYGFYRLHLPDPVFFQREIRASIQQIGYFGKGQGELIKRRGLPLFHGEEPVNLDQGGMFERQDDWSSCVWFYLDRPVNALPPLAPLAQRIAAPNTGS